VPYSKRQRAARDSGDATAAGAELAHAE